MVRPDWGDATKDVFRAGEGFEVGFAGILGMGWFWEVGKGLAWAM